MRIDFYHLITKMTEQVLPVLAEKSLGTGKVLMRVFDGEQADYFDKFLWYYKDDGWIPHGLAGNPDAELQPFLITDSDDNLNGANVLFVVSAVPVDLEKIIKNNEFERVLVIFPDNDVASKDNARKLWSVAVGSGCEHHYWKL